MPEKRIVEFEFERETKGTFRFKEVAPAGTPETIGPLYVRKWVFAKKPEKLKVTVEW